MEPEEKLGPGTRTTLVFDTSQPTFDALGDTDEERQAHFLPDIPEVKVQLKNSKGEKKDHFWRERRSGSGKISGSQLLKPEKQLGPETSATLAFETFVP